MNKDVISAMAYLILALSMTTPVTPNDHLLTQCKPDMPITSTQFQHNLDTILKSLPSNTSQASGYFNISIGVDPDDVHGQALCRGDVDSTTCQKCLENATQRLEKECKGHQDAVTWFDLCQARYSYRMFISITEYSGKRPKQNDEKKRVPHPEKFGEQWTRLMGNLSDEAAFSASKNMFAAGEIYASEKETIYGLVQCTRDLSTNDCKNCLESALGDLDGCCSAKEGGTILSGSCIVRFELFRFFNGSSLRLTYQRSKAKRTWKKWKVVAGSCTLLGLAVLAAGSYAVYLRWKKGSTLDQEVRSESSLLHHLASPSGSAITSSVDQLVSSEELPVMDLATVRTATNEFSDINKIGQGGFGTVFKGVLTDGKEVAVKRLSLTSWQGLEEFKNELVLIAKLQHRNLVRLLGCSMEGEEKLLIYEFMPNKSLDNFIFDSEKRSKLDWKTCYNIISGIARGLVYLHEDSRLRIIHRDLKPSNVLLDNEMVAKISDFGMARIFCDDQNTANTKRVVGTYGYMAPEYAMEGLFSTKSDVFSFGVILLEIVSGKRNSGSYLKQHSLTLIRHAWRVWKEGKELEFVDPMMVESCPIDEVLKCMQIGLLCVQQDPIDRPNMSSVLVMLGSSGSTTLPEPRQPAFCHGPSCTNGSLFNYNPNPFCSC